MVREARVKAVCDAYWNARKHFGLSKRQAVSLAERRFQDFCLDCKADTLDLREQYVLLDSIWTSLNPDISGSLCLNCAERRLGRTLNSDDFSDSIVNARFANVSEALAKRGAGQSAMKKVDGLSQSQETQVELTAAQARSLTEQARINPSYIAAEDTLKCIENDIERMSKALHRETWIYLPAFEHGPKSVGHALDTLTARGFEVSIECREECYMFNVKW